MKVDVPEHPVDVQRYTARQLAKQVAEGGISKREVLAGRPPDVRREVERILRDGELDMKSQRRLRRAKITELIVDGDPKVSAAGIALSQREDPVQPIQPVGLVGWNHWAQEPPDRRQLEAVDETE